MDSLKIIIARANFEKGITMEKLSRRSFIRAGIVSAAVLATGVGGHVSASAEMPETTQMTAIPYSEEFKKMAHEILLSAGNSYTDDQLKEIPRILNTKSRYFWGNDLNDWDVLKDVFTEEGINEFQAFWTGGQGGKISIDDQIGSVMWSIGPDENVVPTHYGHNQIVRFIDDTHAQLMTRMQDHHVYMDNGEVYAGYGMYIDDIGRHFYYRDRCGTWADFAFAG